MESSESHRRFTNESQSYSRSSAVNLSLIEPRDGLNLAMSSLKVEMVAFLLDSPFDES